MSSEAFLTGLYRSEIPSDFWNTHLAWQSYPVHTSPADLDYILQADWKCDIFQKHYDEVVQSDEIKEYDRKHKDLYDYLSLHTGETVNTLFDTVPIRDTLLVERDANKR